MNYAVILASGSGERIRSDIPKQFIPVGGKPLIEYTIEAFEKNINIDRIIIVSNPLYMDLMEEIVLKSRYSKFFKLLGGGKIRQESSSIGVGLIDDDNDNILIHDGVRPFVTQKIINDCLDGLDHYKAVTVAITLVDTVVEVNDRNIIENIPRRKYLRRVQTPQGFKAGIIKKAHMLAKEDKDFEFTDDSGLVRRYNLADIFIIEGDERNIKVTYPEDIQMMERIFKEREIL